MRVYHGYARIRVVAEEEVGDLAPAKVSHQGRPDTELLLLRF